MFNEHHLIYSPLQQRMTEKDRWLEIHIYRMPNTGWTLEVVDDKGCSTVWDGEFNTDKEAFDQALAEITEVGISNFIDQPPASSLH